MHICCVSALLWCLLVKCALNLSPKQFWMVHFSFRADTVEACAASSQQPDILSTSITAFKGTSNTHSYTQKGLREPWGQVIYARIGWIVTVSFCMRVHERVQMCVCGLSSAGFRRNTPTVPPCSCSVANLKEAPSCLLLILYVLLSISLHTEVWKTHI